VIAARREPAELTPRKVAPEKNLDLSAMRELANYSAKSAIDQHARRMMTSVGRNKLLVSIVSTITSLGLIWMWSVANSSIAFSGAAVSLVIAVFWAIQYLLVSRRIRGTAEVTSKVEEKRAHQPDKPTVEESKAAGPPSA
jgi:hypothetical protein